MKVYKILFLALISSILLFSCAGDPEETPVIIEEPEDIIDSTPEDVVVVEEEEFVVTEDLYQTTFAEIEALIEELNSNISNKKFESWKSYLSEKYIENYSDRDTLALVSESPILADQGIRLSTLEDYFRYIVVPSRNNIELNDIEFETETRITVWSLFKGRRVKLYQLEKIDDNWKISIW